MRILRPNTGDDVVAVIKSNIFLYITDYGLKSFLKEIIVAPGQHHWEWVVFNSHNPIDIKDIGDRFSTFDNALNQAVNDPYRTIYEFKDFNEMIKEWGSIVYIDCIQTVYKS